MIERYTLPEMGKIWTESAKFQSWLKVEIAACEANFSLGKIPENAMKERYVQMQSLMNLELQKLRKKLNMMS